MSQYKTIKTTMGHKIRVHMSDQEVLERFLYRVTITVLPFFGSALMFWIWVKVG